jgi:uncharacterized protein YdhG (YjbR/CyaY superfamily)
MKVQRSTGPNDVEAYLVTVPPKMRTALQQLRKTIRDVAPDAEEVLSYGIPAFRQNGMLVYYAAFKDHCSFFAGSVTVLRKFAKELKPFAAGKGTLQFTPQRPIPPALVRRLVRERITENASRVAAKRAKTKRSSKEPRRSRRGSRN